MSTQVRNKRLDDKEFALMREEVLSMWPTGKGYSVGKRRLFGRIII
jgi:hypothetical protein